MPENRWVKPIVLEGDGIRMEPLVIGHAAGLAAIAEPDLFRYFAGFRPEGRDVEAGEAFVRSVLGQPNKVAFAVVDRATTQVIGSTSFMDIRSESRGLEIGSTWIATPVQGTAVNPEAKLLMLTHAFDQLGAIRVQFRTDARNLRSQRAIEKLGAKRDGIFRHDTIMPDGYLRDSVFYSILAEEWPAVRDSLVSRLGGEVA
ncbi:MAG: GNAT family protein [Fimbriimonas sp.]|nr:GNAT family protein [Fimbriimonas sp.]